MVCFFPTWFWDRASTLRSVLLRRVELARRLQLATARLASAIVSFSKAVLSFLMDARQLLLAGPALHGDPLADHTAASVPSPAAGAIGTAEARHVEEPEPAELRSSLATNLLAFFFIFYILCWNLTTATSFTLPERTVPLGPFLGLDQYWGMFAPSPSDEDGWYVIPGELRDGQKVDLMPITRDDYSMHPITGVSTWRTSTIRITPTSACTSASTSAASGTPIIRAQRPSKPSGSSTCWR
jgi:hypothetical protein